MKLYRFIIISIFIASTILLSNAIAEQASSSVSSDVLVVAPEGLTGREQHQLEQGYRNTYRNKQNILSPGYAGGPTVAGPDEATIREQTEAEKLYRYFGIAMNLVEEDKYDEAIEILKFISERKPDDKYVKSTLKKVISDSKAYKRRWRVDTQKGARMLKAENIKNMTEDGVAYYYQKRYDMALLKFSDILALDPGNKNAQRYMDKLKSYYFKEAKVERIAKKYEAKEDIAQAGVGSGEGLSRTDKLMDKEEIAIKGAAEKMLNQQEVARSGAVAPKNTKAKSGAIKATKVAEKLLDKKEMDSILEKKRVDALLDQAELGQLVENIVTARKQEERKKDEMAIGGGDVIGVIVRDHPELSGKTLVTYGGETMLPLVNDPVMVKGLTTQEASEKITKVMAKYVKDPDVAVVIEEYKSKMFYVIDDIGCTPYPITRPNMTIRDALFLSDWGTNRALGRVIVMKPDKIHPIVRKVDAFDIIYRGNLAGNLRIDDGDVIYAPMTIVGKTTQTINDTTSPISALQNARNLWLQGKWTEKGLKSMFRIYPDQQSLPQNVGQ